MKDPEQCLMCDRIRVNGHWGKVSPYLLAGMAERGIKPVNVICTDCKSYKPQPLARR